MARTRAISVRVDEEEMSWLNQLALERHTTPSSIIRTILFRAYREEMAHFGTGLPPFHKGRVENATVTGSHEGTGDARLRPTGEGDGPR